jgi:hypothetical protein
MKIWRKATKSRSRIWSSKYKNSRQFCRDSSNRIVQTTIGKSSWLRRSQLNNYNQVLIARNNFPYSLRILSTYKKSKISMAEYSFSKKKELLIMTCWVVMKRLLMNCGSINFCSSPTISTKKRDRGVQNSTGRARKKKHIKHFG